MDPSKTAVTSTLGEAGYIQFPSLPDDAKHEDGTLALNRYSSTITRGHDFPGAKVGTVAQSISVTRWVIDWEHQLILPISFK